MEKQARRAELERFKRKRARERAAARRVRAKRSIAFKKNVERFGLMKAKMIASIITKKARKEF